MPLDCPAAASVVVVAGAVNRRAVIQPKQHDHTWTVVPNLWGAIVLPPGYMKTPVMKALVRPLESLEADWRREHERAQAEYALKNEEHELQLAAWKEQYKKACNTERAKPERPGAPQQPRPARRLISNDATFEALHRIMSENPAGLFVSRDELTGWLNTLDQPDRGAERGFFLQAWDGDTGYTMDRIGRGTLYVPACCLSLFGGIQPARLRPYLAETLSDGPGNDGLVQRLQVMVWPDTDSRFAIIDRAPDEAARAKLVSVLGQLTEMSADPPTKLCFSPAGQAIFFEWLTDLEHKVRNPDLHPALASHLSKYRSLMPSLALLFELADAAFYGRAADCVSSRNATLAANWCKYLESHARRIYACAINPQLRAAAELAEKLRTRKIGAGGSFSRRDVYLKGWTMLDSPESVTRAAEVLKDASWIRDSVDAKRPQGGRPSERYDVNPLIFGE